MITPCYNDQQAASGATRSRPVLGRFAPTKSKDALNSSDDYSLPDCPRSASTPLLCLFVATFSGDLAVLVEVVPEPSSRSCL